MGAEAFQDPSPGVIVVLVVGQTFLNRNGGMDEVLTPFSPTRLLLSPTTLVCINLYA